MFIHSAQCRLRTQTSGSLSSKMHSIQADCTLGSSHVKAHSEAMRDVVMHSLLYTSTKLCNIKWEKEVGNGKNDRKIGSCSKLE